MIDELHARREARRLAAVDARNAAIDIPWPTESEMAEISRRNIEAAKLEEESRIDIDDVIARRPGAQ